MGVGRNCYFLLSFPFPLPSPLSVRYPFPSSSLWHPVSPVCLYAPCIEMQVIWMDSHTSVVRVYACTVFHPTRNWVTFCWQSSLTARHTSQKSRRERADITMFARSAETLIRRWWVVTFKSGRHAWCLLSQCILYICFQLQLLWLAIDLYI